MDVSDMRPQSLPQAFKFDVTYTMIFTGLLYKFIDLRIVYMANLGE